MRSNEALGFLTGHKGNIEEQVQVRGGEGRNCVSVV